MSNGSEINEIDSDAKPRIVRFSSDALQVIIGCEYNRVRIWDWQKCPASLKEVLLPVFCTLEIACDQNVLYTCSTDMHVCKISLNSLKMSTVRQGLPVPIILPYGNGILLGSLYNNKFLHWEIPTFPLVHINAGGYIRDNLKLLNTFSH